MIPAALIVHAMFSVQGGPSTEELVADATRSSVSVPFFLRPFSPNWAVLPSETEVPKPPRKKGRNDQAKDPNGSTTRPRGRSWFAGHR